MPASRPSPRPAHHRSLLAGVCLPPSPLVGEGRGEGCATSPALPRSPREAPAPPTAPRNPPAGPLRWALLIAFLAGGSAAAQQPRLELGPWQGRAQLLPNAGPGETYFRLVATLSEVDPAAPAPAALDVRTTLPDGRSETHPVPPREGPRAGLVSVYVPARSVRNLRPAQVVVRAVMVSGDGGPPISNELIARIDDFPTPDPGNPPADPGPFGWGRPLDPSHAAAIPRPGPDGLRFVRVPATGEIPAFLIATTEATNAQLAARLRDYRPPADRSDEFALEAPDQPAFGLTPAHARRYLQALTAADRTGIAYRLPARAEWLRAARAGRDSAFWWGDEPTHPAGANFLGPEPPLPTDTTAGPNRRPPYTPNPWGLLHTFGNIAEWATTPEGGFVRLGGHFRTEPPPDEVAVPAADQTGPDLFVGVRPAFDLSSAAASRIAQRQLAAGPRLAGLSVTVDADRMTATITGAVPEPALRRLADRRLAALWWLAAVENRLTTPTIPAHHLARLGPAAGAPVASIQLGRRLLTVPVAVRWADRLPVAGSEWWVNLDAAGQSSSYRLDPREIGGREPLPITLDATRLPPGAEATAWLSLAAPASSPSEAAAVTAPFRLRLP